MKNIIIKAAASVLVAGMLSGCSSDYLDVTPVTAVPTGTVLETEEGAQYALYGLCQTMYCPMGDFFSNYLFTNGEPYIATVYGEVLGQDYFSLMWAESTGGNFMWQNNDLPDGWIPIIPWSYCYNLIGQANTILSGIDTIEGNEDHLHFMKAQALTIRAHAYTRLLQLYAPRWENSNNGEKYCIVIRTEPGVNDAPLSTMNEALKRIYDDCNDAIALYEDCGMRRSYTWEPNINVCQGILARAALLKHDWPTAQLMAHDARQNYPIMSADDYKNGFCMPNEEWMWECYGEQKALYYAAYGSMYACNGPYPGIWGYGAGAINYELYKKFPRGDIRSDLFFTPDKLVGQSLSRSAFWNTSYIEETTMNLNSKDNIMIAQINRYEESHYPTDKSIEWPAPYNNFMTGSNKDCKVAFGAQFKFWGVDNYGTGSFCVMRGAEMLLTEAEAAYHNGETSVAVANLKELNAKRCEGYECNQTGAALLEEIQLQRRFELWGEGFNFFDLKRWNLPMVRSPWEKGNTASNNIPVLYRMEKQPNDRGWRFAVPLTESRYNKLVDRNLLAD
ncbi:MAG: RagB/SusD family nutrient uptake outer membrane protein [Muribaculaceae bacterium]|nr:RagB/SusD family nutrient uptake outer membrane protein [Muribaculaceae bacterium]